MTHQTDCAILSTVIREHRNSYLSLLSKKSIRFQCGGGLHPQKRAARTELAIRVRDREDWEEKKCSRTWMAPGKQPNCDVLGNLRLRCLLYWLRKEQGRGGASVAGDSPKDSVARGNLPCLSCSPSEKMQAQEAVTLFYRGEVCGPKSTACYVGALPLDYFYQPLCFNVEKLGLFLPRPASAHTNNSGGNKRSCLLSSLPA